MTPEPSVRALLAQWQKEAGAGELNSKRWPWTRTYSDRDIRSVVVEKAAQLEAALKLHDAKLADLAADMERFAEEHSLPSKLNTEKWYSPAAKAALAWAARLKALQEP